MNVSQILSVLDGTNASIGDAQMLAESASQALADASAELRAVLEGAESSSILASLQNSWHAGERVLKDLIASAESLNDYRLRLAGGHGSLNGNRAVSASKSPPVARLSIASSEVVEAAPSHDHAQVGITEATRRPSRGRIAVSFISKLLERTPEVSGAAGVWLGVLGVAASAAESVLELAEDEDYRSVVQSEVLVRRNRLEQHVSEIREKFWDFIRLAVVVGNYDVKLPWTTSWRNP